MKKAMRKDKTPAGRRAALRAVRARAIRERMRSARRLQAWRRSLTSDWRAIQVAPNMERRVFDGLKQNGLSAYVPTEVIWRRDTRTGRKYHHPLPLIRGYVFAEVPDAKLHLVHSVAGAVRLVAFCGRPIRLDPAFVEELQAHEAVGKFDKTLQDAQRRKLERDAPVRVTEGKFAGWIGSVVRMSGDRRVRLLLSLFGRQTEVEVQVDGVEVLEEAA